MKWLAAVFLILGISAYFLGCFEGVNPESVRGVVSEFGMLAPLIFIALFTIAPLAPFFNAVLAIAGGLIFGLWFGSVLIMLGALCGGTVGFWIARKFGEWLRKRKDDPSLKKLEQVMGQNGFLIVLLLRLIPLIPFDIISYGAGFSSIKYRDYIIATMLGIIPGVFVYANIGANTLELNSPGFYLAISFLVILSVVSLLLKKRLKKRLNVEEQPE